MQALNLIIVISPFTFIDFTGHGPTEKMDSGADRDVSDVLYLHLQNHQTIADIISN